MGIYDCLRGRYPLVMTNIAIEHGPVEIVSCPSFPWNKWWSSTVVWVYQRVPRIGMSDDSWYTMFSILWEYFGGSQWDFLKATAPRSQWPCLNANLSPSPVDLGYHIFRQNHLSTILFPNSIYYSGDHIGQRLAWSLTMAIYIYIYTWWTWSNVFRFSCTNFAKYSSTM